MPINTLQQAADVRNWAHKVLNDSCAPNMSRIDGLHCSLAKDVIQMYDFGKILWERIYPKTINRSQNDETDY